MLIGDKSTKLLTLHLYIKVEKRDYGGATASKDVDSNIKVYCPLH